jgi:hypothetical protein
MSNYRRKVHILKFLVLESLRPVAGCLAPENLMYLTFSSVPNIREPSIFSRSVTVDMPNRHVQVASRLANLPKRRFT